jgi:hypothetical protein
MRILIVSFTKKKDYYDGFYSAISVLQNKYNIDFWKTKFDTKLRNFKKYELILFKGNFGVDYSKLINFKKTKKTKVGLIISSTHSPTKKELEYYDILFYETNWYYNNNKLLQKFKHCYHAFGVDTNIMKYYNIILKDIDVLSIGTFAKYKRQHLITQFEGTKVIYGNKYNNDNNIIIKSLEDNGIIIKGAVSYSELAQIYNRSKLCYIPCTIDGGGERAILEARACGVNVQVESDNLKLQELCESKIYSHIDYAQSIENGIKKLFKIQDANLANNWFIAIKKYDNDIYNFNNYDSILYKNLIINNINYLTSYIADPFIIKNNNINYLFFEYKNLQNKGVIGCINLDSKPYNIDIVLEQSYHMSYPFIFIESNKFYMIPETHGSNRLELYEAVDFPNKWKLHHYMIENINLSDTTLFKYNDIYWLFTTLNNNNKKLTIFYSDDLFSKNWVKHPYSIDNHSNRCAGKIFIKNNMIYRPSQKSIKYRLNVKSSRIYGHSLIIYEIQTLTKTEYIEKNITNIKPSWFPNIYGTHTLNFNEDYIVWDGKFKLVS